MPSTSIAVTCSTVFPTMRNPSQKSAPAADGLESLSHTNSATPIVIASPVVFTTRNFCRHPRTGHY